MRHFVLLIILLSTRLLTLAQYGCRSAEYKQALQRDPSIAAKMQEVESFTSRKLHPTVMVTGGDDTGAGNKSLITIPVIVHVVYNTAAQNITDEQIFSQILVLNRDYQKLNGDTTAIPGYYRDLAASCNIRFALAVIDADGKGTTGIVRKQTSTRVFATDDAVKFAARGGDDAWDRDRYLNIWVCDLTTGILGYASAPGSPAEVDGVAIDYTAFGTKGTATAPFNLGRTATHEIGHWLNLIHVWGDADCGNDYVDDTPKQQTATRGNPSGMIFSCGNTPYGNLYMDYMDFTDDIGMHLFTYGQRDRIRTLFKDGGFRAPLLTSDAAPAMPTITDPQPPVTPAADSSVSLRFSPNPTFNMVQVVTSGPSSVGSQLEVYTQTGQLVKAVLITQTSFSINISSLPAGLYFVRIKNGTTNKPARLIKM